MGIVLCDYGNNIIANCQHTQKIQQTTFFTQLKILGVACNKQSVIVPNNCHLHFIKVPCIHT